MSTAIEQGKDIPAAAAGGSGPQPKQTKTVLLSDIPDASTLTVSALPSAVPENSTLDAGALALLGQRYDIIGEAGRGPLDTAYKARDRQTQRLVILKPIEPAFASDQTLMNQLKSDILSARKLSHKNIGRAYDFNRIGEVAYLSADFPEGESLRSTLVRLGRLPLRNALNLTLQICSGLKAAHGQGIVHGCFKPENVLVDAKGGVKIVEFGTSRFADSMARASRSIGTRPYMAPEQISGKPVDFRTDIYALGLVLYESFTGHQPASGATAASPPVAGVRGVMIPPHEIEPTIPVSVERAILKCLERDPANRFRSIDELEIALTSSGALAVLASSSDRTQTLTNREAIASPPIARLPQIPRPRRNSQRASLLLWALVAACTVFTTGEGFHWARVSRAAKNVALPPTPAVPAAPAFALDKARKPKAPRAPKDIDTPERLGLAGDPKDEITPFATPDRSAPEIENSPAAIGARKWSAPSSPAISVSPTGNSQAARTASVLSSPGGSSQFLANTYLWIARFPQESDARESAKKIGEIGLPVVVVSRRNPSGEFFVLLAGPLDAPKVSDAEAQLGDLGFPNAHPIKNLIIDHRRNP